MSELRSAIIGTGFMGRVHAQAVLSNGGRVVGFVGSTPASGDRASAGYPGAAGAADIAEILDRKPDVVHICTPNALHAEQAEQVLTAGIPVICEKPLATTAAAAEQLVRLAADLPTGVPFVYRYHPLVRQIRQQIAADRDNRLWMLHGSYLQDWLADRGASNWRVDPAVGGTSRAFADIGVHWVDLMEFVTGHRITSVCARFGNAFEREGGPAQNATEDGGVILFETDHGAVGTLAVSQASAGRKNRLWFSFDGSQASYSFDQEQPETAWLGTVTQNSILVRDPSRQHGDAARPEALPAGHAQGYQQCFNDFVADMYATIREGGPTAGMPTFADGLRAALITESVVRSAGDHSWAPVSPAAVLADAY